MINNIEGEVMLGTDEEFHRLLNEFRRGCFERSRIIFWMILKSPRNCWPFIKCLVGRIKHKFLEQPFATIVCYLSIVLSCATGAFVSPIIIIYYLTCFICSVESIFCQRGLAVCTCTNSDEILEQERLLEQFKQAYQSADDGAKNKRQPSQRALETLMEPRPESGAPLAARSPFQVPYDFHHSDMYTPLSYNESSAEPSPAHKPFSTYVYGANSEGPSSAPDPFPPLNYDDDTPAKASGTSAKASGTSVEESRTSDPSTFYTSTEADVTSGGSFEDTTNLFIPTHFSDDSYDSDEPPQRLSHARISNEAVNAFGHPVQVLGTDYYKLENSSDEHSTTDELFPASGHITTDKSLPALGSSEVHATIEVSVEVHPEPRRSINSSNNSGSSEPASMISDESAVRVISELFDNIPYMDDDMSSETTCSTPLDEESTKTED